MKRMGAAVHLAIGLAAAAAIAWAGVSSVASSSSSSAKARAKRSPLTNQELAVALTRVALDPEPLAAAGLTSQATTDLVGRVRTHLTTGIIGLRAADADWFARSAEVERLERRIRGGQGTPEDVTALAAARTALANAVSTRQAVLDAIVSESVGGEGGLSGPQAATLAVIRAGRGGATGGVGGWELPTKYLAASREEPAWVALRDALANLRISAEQGVSPDPAAQSIVAAANANQAVAAAASGLSNLPAVQSAWNTAVFP